MEINMNAKKFVCFVLAAIMTFSFAACTTDPGVESTPESSSTETPAETPAETPSETPAETEPKETEPPRSYLKIGGIDISEYTIVYSSDNKAGEKLNAEKLADHIQSTFDISMVVESDSDCEAEKAILIGACRQYLESSVKKELEALEGYLVNTNTATVVSANNLVWVSGTNMYTVEAGVDKIIADAVPAQAGDTVELDYSGEKAVSVVAESLGEILKVMTYNIQTGTPTKQRATQMIKNITDFMPDVIGTQEANNSWLSFFNIMGLMKEYTFVGKPRLEESNKSNGNEFSAILFRTSKFNLLDSGTYWLSDTPEVVGSTLASSEYPRIMTYAVLERKSDGAVFVNVNTHMSWDAKGEKTNLMQMKIILSLVEEKIYSKHGMIPTYFTGDFNVLMSSEGYKHLLSTGTSDARKLADISSNENTFPGKIIDYCIVSNGDFQVATFDVGFELPGSDHYPVYIEMYLTPQEK